MEESVKITKICSKCGEEKELSEFSFRKDNNKYRSQCKKCVNSIKLNYRKAKKQAYNDLHKEEIEKLSALKEANKALRKEQKRLYGIDYRKKNKDFLNKKRRESGYSKNYYLNNIERERKRSQDKHHKNKDKEKEYRTKNKDKISARIKEKYNNDPLFKLKQNIRSRLKIFIKKSGFYKNASSFKLLGCTPEELKEYIEKQFTSGMTWNNHTADGWHIDHIIPLSSAKTQEDLERLFHYTNLQPLWWKDNLTKGNKIITNDDN